MQGVAVSALRPLVQQRFLAELRTSCQQAQQDDANRPHPLEDLEWFLREKRLRGSAAIPSSCSRMRPGDKPGRMCVWLACNAFRSTLLPTTPTR